MMNSIPAQGSARPTMGSPSHSTGHSASGYLGWGASTMGGSSAGTFGTSATTLNDALAQSRLQYQPGYLMSLAQGQSVSPSTQRYEEAPIIPTKAKINPAFARTASSDFGTESMFESSKHRQRETFDENGPPATSLVDLMDEIQSDSFGRGQFNRTEFTSPRRMSTTNNRDTTFAQTSSKHAPLHIVVFGYPPARYSSTVAYFKSLADGGTTEVEQSEDVENAFKIGYHEVWEAARAWRRNGDIISGEGGRWMIGAKWADSQLAEQLLGFVAQSQSSFPSTQTLDPTPSRMDTSPDPSFGQLQRLGPSRHDSNPSIGTPIKITPASAAFKKTRPDVSLHAKSSQSTQLPAGTTQMGTPSPSKGVVGQFSDLIFGW